MTVHLLIVSRGPLPCGARWVNGARGVWNPSAVTCEGCRASPEFEEARALEERWPITKTQGLRVLQAKWVCP